MEICIEKILTHINPILLNSAKYFMRVGNYNDCIREEGMDYNSVFFNQLGNNIAMLYTGLCLPVECTPPLIQQAIDGLAEALGQDLRVAFINNKIEEKTEPFTWVFYLTLILLLVLLILLTAVSDIVRQLLPAEFTKDIEISTRQPLNILNGVRSLAMLCVIYGHQYSLVIINTSNILSINQILYSWKELIIEAAILAVDTFFFVGGFLVGYSVLKQDKVKSKLRYPLALLNRYLRFIPSYLIAILLYYSVMPHLVSGPFWFQNTPNLKNCERMWKPLLFVDNLVDNGNSQCMGWGWYLQNDMQIFIASLFILFIYSKSRFWPFITMFATIAVSFAYTMQMSFDNSYKYTTHMTDFDTYGDYMSYLYIKPWSRCPPYIFGLLIGILYVEFAASEKQLTKHSPQKPDLGNLGSESPQGHFLLKFKQFLLGNPWKRRLIELVGIAIDCFVIFIPRTAQGDDRHWSQLTHSLFLTYSKLLFIVGLALLLLPSLLGINGLVKFLLDTKLFNLIAKVSFWTYLIHLTIMFRWITSIKLDFYYAYVPLFVLATTTAVQSMLAGFLLYLLVEVPFLNLQKKMIASLFSFIAKKTEDTPRPKHQDQQGGSQSRLDQ